MKQVEGKIRKACGLYGLIDDGDRVALGVSGGKDSVTMLAAMHSFARYSEKRFTLDVLILDPQFEGEETDYSALTGYCAARGLPVHIRRTNIGGVVFGLRDEKNPCSLCARMRRGVLHDMCVELGCNKIALGHHMDDAVETLFMNLFHEGRLESFYPKTYLSRKNITMIRPMILAEEREIASAARRLLLPVVKSRCPKDGFSERETIKRFIRQKEKEYPGFLHRTFYAMQRGDISGLKPGAIPFSKV